MSDYKNKAVNGNASVPDKTRNGHHDQQQSNHQQQPATQSQQPNSSDDNGPSSWVESRDAGDHNGTDFLPIRTINNNYANDLNHSPGNSDDSSVTRNQQNDGKYSLMQFALVNFAEAIEKYEVVQEPPPNGNHSSGFVMETLRARKKNKKTSKGDKNEWTWKELSDLVKFSPAMISQPLLRHPHAELQRLALECFACIMRYMGDQPLPANQTEVDCVYAILLNCHRHGAIRDEVFCQLMKQTTSNKSSRQDSCQRGWRLFSIVAAYFDCSANLRPYLFHYLETSAYDKRRAYHATALVCLQNLRKTIRYGGRKNVPSIEEIAAISAGRNSKRQMYRLPGGSERIINTKSCTVVNDVIEEICAQLGVPTGPEQQEFSLYCIVEGDPYTMPLNRDEYILDITTELLKNGQIFYLIFCRSVWHYPLRLDSQLYIEVIFNQVAPDYLEGLLLVLDRKWSAMVHAEQLNNAGSSAIESNNGQQPSDSVPRSLVDLPLPDHLIKDLSEIAALLHRAADMEHQPSKDEVKYLLPKPILPMRAVRPARWVELVQENWSNMAAISTTEAKAQCLDILCRWPLFGSCFFAIRHVLPDALPHEFPEYILALNKNGAHFLHLLTHETICEYAYVDIISTRKVRAEDGTLFLDIKCGNLMLQKITRIQTDQAHEISRLIRQYIDIQNYDRMGHRS